MLSVYRAEFTAVGAEKMWDFSLSHEVNIVFHYVDIPQPVDPQYSKYFYDIVMSDDTATIFVLTTAPLSCRKVR